MNRTNSDHWVEDEASTHVNVSGAGVETEFYGGEQTDEPENEDVCAGAWRPRSLYGTTD